MTSVSSISSSAPNPIQDVARAARAAGGSSELRQELIGQVAERVGNGDYVKAELTAAAAEELAQSSNYRPGQVLNKVA